MKRVLLLFLLLPIAAMSQTGKLSEAQSKLLVEKLAKLLQRYDTSFDQFDFAADCNFAILTDSNNLQCIIDIDGTVLLPRQYHVYRQDGTALFLVVGDTTMGLIDKDMRWVLPMEYDHNIDCLECLDMCSFFKDGYAVMCKEWLYGVVDTGGKILVPFKFENPFGVDIDNQLLYFFNEEEEFDVVTVTGFDGKKLMGPYQWIGRFNEGLAGFQKNDSFGFLDMKGNIVIPAKYDFTGWSFDNGTTLVNRDEKQMLIDRNGKVKHLFDEDYEVELPLWHNSIFVVKKYYDVNFSLAGDYGVVDSKGSILVPLKYQACNIINDKYFAMSMENDSCDIYDLSGKLMASFQQTPVAYFVDIEDEVGSFHNDHIAVMKDSLWGIVDSNFNLVLPCRYKELEYLGHGFAKIVNDDNSASIIDLTGRVILQGPYQVFSIVNDQLFKFYSYNPANYGDMIVGFADIFGNTTATPAQTAKMQAWMKTKK